MRDALIIFLLCIVAIIIGGWMFFYAPDNIAVFPQHNKSPVIVEGITEDPLPSSGVAFTEITSGSLATQVSAAKNYVISSADDFAPLWKQITSTHIPTVDFKQYSVIAVFAGERPTSGYGIAIDKITDTPDKRIVHIVLTVPGKNCVTNQTATSPYAVVQVPASTLMPVKEMVTQTHDCE